MWLVSTAKSPKVSIDFSFEAAPFGCCTVVSLDLVDKAFSRCLIWQIHFTGVHSSLHNSDQ